MNTAIDIHVKIRLANKTDLLIGKGLLKFGQPYYLKDPKTHQISGVYMLDKFTSSEKLKALFIQNCIYVPVLNYTDSIVTELQQTALKEAMNYE